MLPRGLRQRAEAGSSTVELVIVFPLLLLCLLLVIQFAVWYHARHVALAAAEEGARAARVRTGTAAAGQARAERFLRELGPTIVQTPRITATRGLDQARVDVWGRAQPVVPWLRLPIHEASQGPVERFRSPTE